MTWDEIVALDDESLLFWLYDKYPEGKLNDGALWVRNEPDAYQVDSWRPWNPLEDWRDTMALVWRYKLSLLHYQGEWSVSNRHKPRDPHDFAATEADARRAICRLALWAAQQGEDKS